MLAARQTFILVYGGDYQKSFFELLINQSKTSDSFYVQITLQTQPKKLLQPTAPFGMLLTLAHLVVALARQAALSVAVTPVFGFFRRFCVQRDRKNARRFAFEQIDAAQFIEREMNQVVGEIGRAYFFRCVPKAPVLIKISKLIDIQDF